MTGAGEEMDPGPGGDAIVASVAEALARLEAEAEAGLSAAPSAPPDDPFRHQGRQEADDEPHEMFDDGFAGPPDGFDPGDPLLLACAGEPENDIGNSRRLRIRHGGDVAHVQRMGWYAYDGRRYAEDVDGVVLRPYAHAVAEAIALEAMVLEPTPKEAEAIEKAERAAARIADLSHELNALDDDAEMKKAEKDREKRRLRGEMTTLKEVVGRGDLAVKALNSRRTKRRAFAKSSGNTGKIEGMLAEASSYLSAPIAAFDTEPLALNLLNGTLRFVAEDVDDPDCPDPDVTRTVRTWTVRLDPHRREDLITKLAPVDYDPAARAPIFEAFLARVQPEADNRSYLQRLLGLAVTAIVDEQMFAIFHGEGRNGKSTLIDTVAWLLGDYSTTVPIASLVTDQNRRGQEATPDLVRVPGARLVRSAEPKEGLPLDENLIKELTGGEPVNIRRLNQEFVEVYPVFKLIISCNRKPVIRGSDDGIWRRVHLVPFDVQIPKDEIDKKLKDKLRAEASGILNWLVAGALDYLARGALDPPQAVVAATQEYRDESDTIAAFVRAAVEITHNPNDVVEAGTLYEAFVVYCNKSALTPLGKTTFNRRMPKTALHLGIEKAKSSVSTYAGIVVRDAFRPSHTHY